MWRDDATESPWDAGEWPGEPPWQPLPEAARQSFLLSALLGWGVFGLFAGGMAALGLGFVDGLSWWLPGVALLLLLLALGLGFWQADWAWRYTRWRLDDDGLRLRRGRWWRHERMVPRARVQHLDIERGPIERRFGLATLVVHTAGTAHGALRQAGFAEADAMQLREALVPERREHDDVEQP
jgi:membrane protein YdbS with pleckstrin-like domain